MKIYQSINRYMNAFSLAFISLVGLWIVWHKLPFFWGENKDAPSKMKYGKSKEILFIKGWVKWWMGGGGELLVPLYDREAAAGRRLREQTLQQYCFLVMCSPLLPPTSIRAAVPHCGSWNNFTLSLQSLYFLWGGGRVACKNYIHKLRRVAGLIL